jgi:hypothetical protein
MMAGIEVVHVGAGSPAEILDIVWTFWVGAAALHPCQDVPCSLRAG